MNKKIISYNKKYNSDVLKNDLDFLKINYNFLEIKNIGKSFLGEKIYYLKLGNGNKKIFINASHHANEWMTSLLLMMFIEKYLYLFKNKKIYKIYNTEKLWNKVSLYIVPMVNPDGVNLCLKNKRLLDNNIFSEKYFQYYEKLDFWKANIRGVDLNLNYPSGWEIAVKNKLKKGIMYPGPRDYPGPNPISEIETKNMISFTNLLRFDLTISLHSQGQEIYGFNKIKKCYEIGKMMEKVSNYKLTSPSYDSSFAGYKDWFIDKYNKPSFTIEVGKGIEGKSLLLEDVKKIYDEIEEMFFVVLEYC